MTYLKTALLQAAADRRRRRIVREALSKLDERSLTDIGMNRADIDIRFG